MKLSGRGRSSSRRRQRKGLRAHDATLDKSALGGAYRPTEENRAPASRGRTAGEPARRNRYGHTSHGQDDGVADLALNATSWSEYRSDSFSLREMGLRAVCPRRRCRPRGDRGPDLAPLSEHCSAVPTAPRRACVVLWELKLSVCISCHPRPAALSRRGPRAEQWDRRGTVPAQDGAGRSRESWCRSP